MTEKRHDLDIRRVILLIILKSREGIRFTPLMQKCNLRVGTLQPRLDTYIQRGWIRAKPYKNSKLFFLTNDGIDHLLDLHAMFVKLS